MRDHRDQHVAAFLGAALLDQAFDRDPGVAHRGGDLGEHAGPVGDDEAQVGAADGGGPSRPGASASSSATGIENGAPISPRAMSIRSATTALAVGPSPAPAPWNSSRPEKLPSATTALVAPSTCGERMVARHQARLDALEQARAAVRVRLGQPIRRMT